MFSVLLDMILKCGSGFNIFMSSSLIDILRHSGLVRLLEMLRGEAYPLVFFSLGNSSVLKAGVF